MTIYWAQPICGLKNADENDRKLQTGHQDQANHYAEAYNNMGMHLMIRVS